MKSWVAGAWTLVAAAATASGLVAGVPDLAVSARALAAAAAVLLVAPAFAPALNARLPAGQALRALAWAAGVSLAGALAATGLSGGVVATATGLLAALLLSMLLVTQTLVGLGVPRTGILAALALLMAAPLWLGPLAFLAGSATPVADWVVWLSPTTQLAAAVGCDVLRLDAFYETSALGTMHVTYPRPVAATVGWFAVALGLAGLCFAARSPRGRARGHSGLILLQEPNR